MALINNRIGILEQILRYNDDAEDALVLRKCPAQPWLHLAIVTENGLDYGIVIYVWDTRQVVFEADVNGGHIGALESMYKKKLIPKAKDNRKPLKGGSKWAKLFNMLVTGK